MEGLECSRTYLRILEKKEESKENSENLLKEKQAQSKSLSEDNEAGNYESEVDANIISKEDTGNIGIIVEEKQLEKKVDKKEGNVKAEKFAEYRIFYSDKLRDCKNLSDILDTYVKHTDSSQLLDDLRLRYISMYIFKTKISEEKLGINMLKHLVNKRLSNVSNKAIDGKGSRGDLIEENQSIVGKIDDDLYLELKTKFDKIEPILKRFESKLNIDLLSISIFSDYGLEPIRSDLFMKTLLM